MPDYYEKITAQLAFRQLTRFIGRGMLTYASADVSQTSKFDIPPIELGVRLLPQTVTRIPNGRIISGNSLQWPAFQNGVSTGLSIAPHSMALDSSWVAYNQSEEPSSEHGGFLLGLGLNGHLRSLDKVHAYQYLEARHDPTSVGLLLGLAASFAGSQDKQLTPLAAIGVSSLLPAGGIELNTSPVVQSASIMSIGLLYAGSGKSRMAEATLDEIGRQVSSPMTEPGADEREAYSFSASCAFGLVMLGRGGINPNLDSACVTSLQSYIDRSRGNAATNGVPVDIDYNITAPGATLALGLMYLRTSRSDIASLLTIPQNMHDLDAIRPDLLLVRTLSRALIHWDSIDATQEWLDSQIPEFVQMARKNRFRSPLDEPIELAYYNILAGSCFALALKYAGSLNEPAYRLLYVQTRHFLEGMNASCELFRRFQEK